VRADGSTHFKSGMLWEDRVTSYISLKKLMLFRILVIIIDWSKV
jgi:hypothetical protein